MSFSMKTMFLIASVLPATLADFNVYCGTDCNGFDGAGCVPSCIYPNNPPSCDDVSNSVFDVVSDDASSDCGGTACDGCDAALPSSEWDITRFEINDSQGCSPSHLYWGGGPEGLHFTLYNDNGNVNIVDVDGNGVGNCVIPENPQVVECGGFFGNSGFTHKFDCTSPFFYLESPN